MKQKKDGKKIQNWRKPLAADQLSQRFIKYRYEDPASQYEVFSALPEQRWSASPSLNFFVDSRWNCYDPGGDEWTDEGRFFKFDLWKFFDEVGNASAPLFGPEWLANQKALLVDESSVVAAPQILPIQVPIEQRLSDFIYSLISLPQNLESVQSSIKLAAGDRSDLDMLREVAGYGRWSLSRHLILFSPFWIRRPSTWDRQGNSRALIRHLFVRHDVPGFLYEEWLRRYDFPRFKWIAWFLILGNGGSLKRASAHFWYSAWKVASKFQQFLESAPEDASPVQACMFAEVLRLGGNEVDFNRLLKNDAFVIDPTDDDGDKSHRNFWDESVRWLIKHRDELTDEQSNAILAWAMHKYSEAELNRDSPFSWKRRTVRSTLEHSLEYQREMARPWACYQWRGHGWDWTCEQIEDEKWSFIELTSGEELFNEGQALHHFVARYSGRCTSGHSAIVAMKHNDTSCITIEVNPMTRQIVQARGSYNRSATAKEKSLITLWKKTILQATPLKAEEKQPQ